MLEDLSVLGRMFVRASRCHSAAIHNAVSRLSVGRGVPPVLDYIGEHDGCKQSEISRMGHVSPATATVMLQTMEKKGFIVRKADEEDQRCMRLYITDAGREIARLGKSTADGADVKFFSVLSDKECDALYSILLKLSVNFENEKKEERKA